ncbi:hypothetical protein Bpfe_015807 [Biomphalaria pfeifferi]|uniref:Uncharacterized protein n=1 Tax=Biomphalaria pfeifferi TaxID=112525 RepID=A0AAD8F804_BIOPF|nr:hypothetical protein Bpfe_015807 [Biomphalaria pfeifferi]
MSKVTEEKSRERKSKAKLDRLLDLKKAIMESLHILTRHDRSSDQSKKSSTRQHNVTSAYRLCRASEWCPLNRVDIIRQPDNGSHVVPVLMDPNSQLQNSCQTWPQDMYFGKAISDFQPSLTHSRVELNSTHKDSTHSQEADCKQRSKFTTKSSKQNNVKQSQYNTADDLAKMKHPSCYTDVKMQTAKGNVSKTSPNTIQRHQEVQTEPEEDYPRDVDDINSDIIDYLNQINDKTSTLYQSDPPRRSTCFSPRYDTYDERFCYRYHSPQYLPPERFYRSQEYNTLPTAVDFRYDGSHHFLSYTTPIRQRGYCSPYAYDKDHRVPQSDIRPPSEDSGSVFSSETDSDFIFYPCTSLVDSFKCMALVDSRNTSFLSPPGDLPENINSAFSWRSELFGSSLDDITQQFFYDEDALSDDVFVEDFGGYPTFQTEPSGVGQAHQHEEHISHSFENPLYESPKSLQATIWSRTDVSGEPSEYDYTYRYADIDEVLQNFDLTENQRTDDTGKLSNMNIFSDTHRSASSDSSGSQSVEDHYLNVDHELANVFDSLRRNSTQSKARKMWRQRRARAKKNLKCRKEEAVTSPPSLIFKFIAPPTPGIDDVKPLRGILKRKDSIDHDNAEVKSTSDDKLVHLSKTKLNYQKNDSRYDQDTLLNKQNLDQNFNINPFEHLFQTKQADAVVNGIDVSAKDNNSEKKTFHYVPFQSDNGAVDLVRIWNNSLDVYRWSLSLHKRNRREAKKARKYTAATL